MDIMDIAIAKALAGGGGGSTGGGVLPVKMVFVPDATYTLDKTYTEIVEAINAGSYPFVYLEETEYTAGSPYGFYGGYITVISGLPQSNSFSIEVVVPAYASMGVDSMMFVADSATGELTWTME